jgi:hypothetical protein
MKSRIAHRKKNEYERTKRSTSNRKCLFYYCLLFCGFKVNQILQHYLLQLRVFLVVCQQMNNPEEERH